MSEKTIDIVVIQTTSECGNSSNPENCEGYLEGLSDHYRFNPAYVVEDISDFIGTIVRLAMTRYAKIKTLVIGSHGSGGRVGAAFQIGTKVIDLGSTKELNSLIAIAPYLAKDADVYIMACKTGQSDILLQKVSAVLGGARVHGYTERIYSDDPLHGGGIERVCVGSTCTDSDVQFPRARKQPRIKITYEKGFKV